MASPYTVHIDQAVLDDLQERLGRTRLPDHLQGSRWDYGTESSYLQVTHTITAASTTCNLSATDRQEQFDIFCLLLQLAGHRFYCQILLTAQQMLFWSCRSCCSTGRPHMTGAKKSKF